MHPVGKAVERIDPYDPHKKKEVNTGPGPGKYKVDEHKTINESTKPLPDIGDNIPRLTAPFIMENTDRFGKQIFPKTMNNKVPGPDEYSHPYSYLSEKGGVLDSVGRVYKKGDPALGPGTYNAEKEPKHISFHLNHSVEFVP